MQRKEPEIASLGDGKMFDEWSMFRPAKTNEWTNTFPCYAYLNEPRLVHRRVVTSDDFRQMITSIWRRFNYVGGRNLFSDRVEIFFVDWWNFESETGIYFISQAITLGGQPDFFSDFEKNRDFTFLKRFCRRKKNIQLLQQTFVEIRNNITHPLLFCPEIWIWKYMFLSI